VQHGVTGLLGERWWR